MKALLFGDWEFYIIIDLKNVPRICPMVKTEIYIITKNSNIRWRYFRLFAYESQYGVVNYRPE